MLEEIRIKDLGIISEATLPFTPGLTCITGETGAGKTMVLSALALLLGRRSDASMVRAGSSFTSVEGTWLIPAASPVNSLVDNVGGIIEDQQLYINRTVHRDGKSKAVIGGKTTPASYLGEIGENLVNIHGQSDQIKLRSAAIQRDALDRYAGAPFQELLNTYRTAHAIWTENTRQLEELRNNRAALEHEHAQLTLLLDDIAKVDPQPGEDDALAATAARLGNMEEIRTGITQAANRIYSDDYEATAALAALLDVITALRTIAGYDPAIASLLEQANTAQLTLSELNSDLTAYLSNLDADGASELNSVHERIAALATLKRLYGPTLDDVLARNEAGAQRILEIDPSDDHITHLEEAVEASYADMIALADQLHAARTEASGRLMTAVNTELAGLAMGNATFHVQVTATTTYTRHGNDDVSFLLAAHPGAEPRPLGKGASGGELSRIMLAIEVVLADPDTTPTFIFDEVDSGVGGATAIEIGKRLATLARQAQVIVVTHLPQVAAYADNHLRVLKTSEQDYTSTDVTQLDADHRVTEIARMLSGFADSDSAQAHAQEMLEHARAYKNAS